VNFVNKKMPSRREWIGIGISIVIALAVIISVSIYFASSSSSSDEDNDEFPRIVSFERVDGNDDKIGQTFMYHVTFNKSVVVNTLPATNTDHDGANVIFGEVEATSSEMVVYALPVTVTSGGNVAITIGGEGTDVTFVADTGKMMKVPHLVTSSITTVRDLLHIVSFGMADPSVEVWPGQAVELILEFSESVDSASLDVPLSNTGYAVGTFGSVSISGIANNMATVTWTPDTSVLPSDPNLLIPVAGPSIVAVSPVNPDVKLDDDAMITGLPINVYSIMSDEVTVFALYYEFTNINPSTGIAYGENGDLYVSATEGVVGTTSDGLIKVGKKVNGESEFTTIGELVLPVGGIDKRDSTIVVSRSNVSVIGSVVNDVSIQKLALFRSTDGGDTWGDIEVDVGAAAIIDELWGRTSGYYADGNLSICNGTGNICVGYMDENPVEWSRGSDGGPGQMASSVIDGNQIIAASIDTGTIRVDASIDRGLSWTGSSIVVATDIADQTSIALTPGGRVYVFFTSTIDDSLQYMTADNPFDSVVEWSTTAYQPMGETMVVQSSAGLMSTQSGTTLGVFYTEQGVTGTFFVYMVDHERNLWSDPMKVSDVEGSRLSRTVMSPVDGTISMTMFEGVNNRQHVISVKIT
jgi:hypothetical protein